MARAPRYQMIHNDLLSRITSGELPKGAQLPSEADVARQYGVSRMTVRQALDLLGTQGHVIRRQGVGTHVADGAYPARRLNRLRSFAEEIADAGGEVTSRTVREETAPAPPDIATAFGITPGDHANRLTRVRLVGDSPAAYQDAWIPYAVAPSLCREPLLDGSLHRTLTDRFGVRIRYADQTMTASLLTEEQAGHLAAPPGSPALETRRTTYDSDGGIVELTCSWTLPAFPFLLRIDAE
ncbi:GntR family transcriptional regulator [Streptomyces sp. NPDC049916]|uniref:GntR family transcriptional regulator n=1 Tax=Streptomyces sp. NPDC049916 TaxID=3155156 RepID=UPI00343CB723